jgi:hypothetical protein
MNRLHREVRPQHAHCAIRKPNGLCRRCRYNLSCLYPRCRRIPSPKHVTSILPPSYSHPVSLFQENQLSSGSNLCLQHIYIMQPCNIPSRTVQCHYRLAWTRSGCAARRRYILGLIDLERHERDRIAQMDDLDCTYRLSNRGWMVSLTSCSHATYWAGQSNATIVLHGHDLVVQLGEDIYWGWSISSGMNAIGLRRWTILIAQIDYQIGVEWSRLHQPHEQLLQWPSHGSGAGGQNGDLAPWN